MGLVVIKQTGANAEELQFEFDNADLAFVIESIATGVGATYPVILRRGDEHGLKIDTNVVTPVTDGNLKLGLGQGDVGGPKRFTDVHALLVNGADFVFENGYRLTEANHVYSHMEADEGIFLMDPDWKPILFIDKKGDLHITGRVVEQFIFKDPDVPRREFSSES